MSSLPTFEHTNIDTIPSTVDGIRDSFLAHKTRSLEWRKLQLRKLYWAIKDHEIEITEACKRDIGKPSFETYLVEVGWLLNDIVFICNNLDQWAKDEKAPDIPLMNSLFKPIIRKDPLGCVLVIGAYNFPIQLSIGPCIGAIAAGCTVVLKPSENAPNAAVVMQKIFMTSLDPSCFTVVQGAIPETSALLDQKWDKIFYTGSATVGTIIAKKAAETLTPVTLELGGRNPAIITGNADPRLAARRLLWAKCLNAGQVCVSQNYILVDKDLKAGLIAELKNAIAEFFPQGIKASPDYARIINKKQFQRLKEMLNNTRGKILIGGTMDEDDLFIEPTVVQVESLDDPLVTEESFGPLMPVLEVDNLDEAIRISNQVHDTPLGVYAFGNKKEMAQVLDQTRSGGASMNDGYFHASLPTLPFGGVGSSGQGAYRGRSSFEVFTHRRSVTTTPTWIESMLDVRYPPYTAAKRKKFQGMNDVKPNFGRDGKEKINILAYILKFGAGGAKGGLIRWFVTIVVAVAAKQYMQRSSKL